MKTIMVITSEYLSAVFNEVKKYSFALQGYGSFETACSGLMKVNDLDLLGIGYVGFRLPVRGSHEYKAMEEFLRLCEYLESGKKVLFVLQSDISPEDRKLFSSFKNTRIYVSLVENDITDVVINRQLFGSLLVDSTETYKLEDKEEDSVLRMDINWKMEMHHLTQESIYQCMDVIDLLDDVGRTIENDVYYRKFMREGQTLLALLRKKRIYTFFGYNYKDAVLEKAIDAMDSDAEWCLCQALMRGD